MTKFQFTPEGVASMCQHFYQLDDASLSTSALALAENFNKWMKAHFELSESQVVYLDAIHADLIQFMAANASFALRNRLPIQLIKPAQKSSSDSKITKPETKLQAKILPDGRYEASGEFNVEVSY